MIFFRKSTILYSKRVTGRFDIPQLGIQKTCGKTPPKIAVVDFDMIKKNAKIEINCGKLRKFAKKN